MKSDGRDSNYAKSRPVSPFYDNVLNGMHGIANDDVLVGREEENDEKNQNEVEEEMRLAREMKIPPIPSVEEYKRHKLTHTPYKA